MKALQSIGETSYDDYGRQANGLLTQLEKFYCYFGLKLSYLIFSGTEQTSINLQKKNTSIQEAVSCGDVARSYISQLRSDDSFKQFFPTVVDEAQQYTGEPSVPRYRQPPKTIDGGTAPHRFASAEDYYRSLYFQAVDLVSEQINTRFSQNSLSVPKDMETLLIEAANRDGVVDVAIPNSIQTMYCNDVNFEKAKIQLQMLSDVVKVYKTSQGLRVQQVTSVRTIAEIMNGVPMAKETFSEVDYLLRIYFTIPVTTCTAECSFSCLRRIKTYLRYSMTEERLNNVILLHVHKEETDHLNLKEIASEFVTANDRRLSYFGNFV